MSYLPWVIAGIALVVLLGFIAIRVLKPMSPSKALMAEIDEAAADVGEPAESSGYPGRHVAAHLTYLG